MLFFIAKGVVSILYYKKQDRFYDNFVIRCFNDSTLIVEIIVLYCLSLSLYLAGDYGIEECNFTLIVLAIIAALYVGEKVYFHIKNREYFYVQSNIYDLNEMISKLEFNDVLVKADKSYFVLRDKAKFAKLIENYPLCNSSKLFKERCIKVSVVNSLCVLFCISILLLGILRG